MSKFDKAICEGYEKYLTENPQDLVSIPRELATKILEIIKQSSSKFTHEETPDLYKDIIRSYFQLNDYISSKEEQPPIDSHEDEISVIGAGSKTGKTQYSVDDAVETLATKPSRQLGALGVGSSAYKAAQAVKKRDRLNKAAIDVYNKNTSEIEQTLKDQSNPFR